MTKTFAKKSWIVRGLGALALLVAVVTASGCTSAKKASNEEVTVNVAINAGLTPLAVAKEKGWIEEEFAKYNAKVAWSEFPSGPPLLESLASKRVDLSYLGDGAALSGHSNGLPFKNIAQISDGIGINSLLIPADSQIKTIEDLKGKTIALAKGTTSHVFLLKVLAKHGLKEEDVKLVDLQLTDALPAFTSGKVDAWQTVDPYTTQLTLQKKATILAGVDEQILAPVTIIARNAFAKEHPELVTAFLSVLKKTAEYADQNEDEIADLFAKLKNVPAPVVKVIWKAQNLKVTPIPKQAIEAQQASADLLYQYKFLKKKVKYTDYVDDSFINKVK